MAAVMADTRCIEGCVERSVERCESAGVAEHTPLAAPMCWCVPQCFTAVLLSHRLPHLATLVVSPAMAVSPATAPHPGVRWMLLWLCLLGSAVGPACMRLLLSPRLDSVRL